MSEKELKKPYKWPEPQDRKDACERFCEHISQGLSIKSWPDADDETVAVYMKKYPEDFDPEMIEEAKRKSLLFWEKAGIDGMMGKIFNFNAASWIFNMKNRLGWTDKVDHEHGGKVELVTIVDDITDEE